ncbi:threonine/serine exporter family protein [Nonomuraea turkmeniaca]|uniref:Threonine/serine exporter family protein n=1 Tax=Nonomuraea turkmeniaca TaxID=103838 RepID=A0A5S4FFG0_9ACTN|nr:threonine/serine exporter family protein [Nonomuraea turkmeniaca]TMR17656.1 threonine/serine exporter family protein [Nonomuraea turkmeniaca]
MSETVSDADANRAVSLALRVGELLLANGEGTENVTNAMRAIARTYGVRRIEADVNLSALTLSNVPDDGRPPVTAERRVRRRQPDFARLVALHDLVGEIIAQKLPLTVARERLHELSSRARIYPRWVAATAPPLVAASAAVLTGGDPVVALAAFIATLLGDRAGTWLARRGVAEFFQTAVAAAVGAATAVLMIWQQIPVQASAVVVGAVIALLPGRPLVACVQDGIAGEYVTATARLSEVVFIVAAVLSGIGIMLTFAVKAGVPITLDDAPTAPLSLAAPQLLGALMLGLTFAVALRVPPRHIPPAALGGLIIWSAYVCLRWLAWPAVLATAVAAAVIGLLGSMYANRVRVPPMLFVIPAIGPLLPGSVLFRGMLKLSLGDVLGGTHYLIEALSTALAIGAGAILGIDVLRALSGRDIARRIRPAARRTRGY